MVIGVTMCIIQAFIATHGNAKYQLSSQIFHPEVDATTLERAPSFFENYFLRFNFDFDFLLLIISVVLIAGAGNIINDYFDVKADRVNKPEKMIVDKYIKRRWAIVFNWVFNAIGLGIALYLSYKYETWLLALIAFFTINFLWFYSALYKRKIFVGNVIVAFLVGIVPVYVLIYNLPLSGFEIPYASSSIDIGPLFVYEVVVSIAIIAFVINLMREIIKDMADIRGDLHLEARTVPIALGIRRTKTILIAMLVPLLVLMAYYVFNIQHYQDVVSTLDFAQQAEGTVIYESLEVFIGFVAASAVICMVSFGVLLTSNTRRKYLIASNMLKFAMLFGMVSPLFL